MSSNHRVAALGSLAIVVVGLAAACDSMSTATLEIPADASSPMDALVDGGASLVDPDAGLASSNLRHGQPCIRDDMCSGGRCLPAPGFPGGFCTRVSCRADGDCSDPSTECVRRSGPDFCAPACASNTDCREGYGCFAVPGSPEVCLPESQRPTSLRADGEPCALGAECLGGTCYLEPEFPGGYCTSAFCVADEGCAAPEGGTADCLYVGVRAETFCAAGCREDWDCRAGYTCQPVAPSRRACLPDEPTGLEEASRYPFAMTCGLAATAGEVAIDYQIADRTRAYTLTTLTRDQAFLAPRTLTRPSGGVVDFATDHAFQSVTSELTGWIQPLTIPAVPRDLGFAEAGPNRLVLETDSRDLCWYLVEETTPGRVVDLNFYFVGVEGLDAASAATNVHFATMRAALDQVLAQAALAVGRVRFFDVTGEDRERFAVIRSEGDIGRAAALSVAPATDLEGALSANIVFVRSIAIGALGVATGIPGPPALHGTRGSGVVVTGELFGQMFSNPTTGTPIDGDTFTAVIVAHELGHFLGLFHTTEGNLSSFDPLDDTPACSPDQFPELCPDRSNLMFPFDPGTRITPDQAFTLGAHALSKE